jgi:hypothetical protein
MNKSIGKPPNETKISGKIEEKQNVSGMNNRSALLYMADTIISFTSPRRDSDGVP